MADAHQALLGVVGVGAHPVVGEVAGGVVDEGVGVALRDLVQGVVGAGGRAGGGLLLQKVIGGIQAVGIGAARIDQRLGEAIGGVVAVGPGARQGAAIISCLIVSDPFTSSTHETKFPSYAALRPTQATLAILITSSYMQYDEQS